MRVLISLHKSRDLETISNDVWTLRLNWQTSWAMIRMRSLINSVGGRPCGILVKISKNDMTLDGKEGVAEVVVLKSMII